MKKWLIILIAVIIIAVAGPKLVKAVDAQMHAAAEQVMDMILAPITG